METNKEKLKREIKEAKEKLKNLQKQEKIDNRKNSIKNLNEYTVEEKIKFFDKMYNYALEELSDFERDGCIDEDNDHYAWELYLSILEKDHDLFWKYWNSLYK